MKKKKVVLVIVATIAVIFLAYESVMHIMYKTCPTCEGEGMAYVACKKCSGGYIDCPRCYATGKITCSSCGGNGRIKCKICLGSGGDRCIYCNGEGCKRCDMCWGSGTGTDGGGVSSAKEEE